MGVWFLPEIPQREVPGILCCTPSRAELRLMSSFVEFPHSLVAAQRVPVIHGITQEGHHITVLKSLLSTRSLNFNMTGSSNPESWVSPLVVYGLHVTPDTLFRGMRCGVPGLNIWQSRRLISRLPRSSDQETYDDYRVADVEEEIIRVEVAQSNFAFYLQHATSQRDGVVRTITGLVACRAG
jgi:ApeA N-terminal domain 1